MYIETANLSDGQAYKLLVGTVVPRPIAFVSTISANGIANCAPFSFFNVVSSDPPMVGLAIARRDGQKKDTIMNIEHSGDFVVNVTVESIAEQMCQAASDFPPDTSEFVEVGLTAVPSTAVQSPRIAESPVSMECRVESVMVVGDPGHLHDYLIGRIVGMHIQDGLMDSNFRMDFRKLKPVGRLAGSLYCRVADLFELNRISTDELTESPKQET